MSTPVTLTGRLGKDPEIRFGGNGKAVARFSVVTTRRVLDKTANTWTDEDTTWWNCTAFGALAENVAESLEKGCAVIVVGRAATDSWDDKTTGEKRTAMKVIADEVAPSLRFATAKITRANREKASGGGGQQANGQQNQGGWGGTPQNADQNQQGGWGGEPPF
jgi:single-strand DNA-binding protein